MTFQNITNNSASTTQANENFQSVAGAGVYGQRQPGTSGLTLGYWGGYFDGGDRADGTVALAASNTVYVVLAKSGYAVSSSTSATNYNDSTNYWRIGVATTGAASITTFKDSRFGPGGTFAGGGGGSTFTGGTLTSALNEAPQVTIASAATVNIGAAAANTVLVSGAVTITAFDSIATGAIRRVRFLAALTLTHNATTLILPASASITTAAGDVAIMESLGAGNWRCVNYSKADGTAVVGGGGSGTVTSVAAAEGVETTSGSAITVTGTIRASTLVNAQTGTTYTYVTGDRGKLVTHSNASAIAGTLPQATSTFGSGWFMRVKNIGAGTLTITPNTSTIGGSATLALTTGQSALIVSDGTNYQTANVSSAASGLAYWTEANATAAPNNVYNCTSFTATGAFAALVPGTTAGGVLAAIPNGAASGGNRRGLRSADFQVQRAAAGDVAAADNSFIGSGYANRIDSGNDYGVIPGGFTNSITGGSGASSVISGGDTNSIPATGTKNAIGGGGTNSITSSAAGATIIGGTSNSIVAGINATILGGDNNRSPGNYSAAMGLQAAGRSVTGVFAHASGKILTRGDAQYERYVLSIQTTNATTTALTSTQGAASASNQPLLASDSAMAFTGVVIARSSTNSAGFRIDGTIANVAGTVTLTGTPTVTAIGATGGAAAWAVTVVADNTNKCLQIQGTGAAATTINWTCALHASYSGI